MFDIPNQVRQAISLDGSNAQNTTPAQNPTIQQPIPQQSGFQPQQPIPQQGSFQPQQPIPQQGSFQPQQPFPPQGSFQPQQPFPPQGSFQPQQPIPQQGSFQPQQPIPQQGSFQPQQPFPPQGGVSLVKGQKVNLSKMNPHLDEIDVCLGWDVGQNRNYDLDSEAFLLGANGQVIGDSWFVFYNQPISPDGSVRHTGDNKTGQGDGDDEIIHIKLSQVNPAVEKIIFVVTINAAKDYGYNFGEVKNAFIRVVDRMTTQELVRFQLSEYYKEVISMMVGELYKKSGEWRFNPIGSGTGDDLEGLCRRYGVHLL